MIYAVLLTSKSMALFKSLVREIRARRIPCHVSVFQSIPELIDSNSFDYADIVLIDASLLNAGALTEGLMRGAMGRRMVVFGRMACERTARILSEAGVQCRPAAENESALCDMLEAMLTSRQRNGPHMHGSTRRKTGASGAERNIRRMIARCRTRMAGWQKRFLTMCGIDHPAPEFLLPQLLCRLRREERRTGRAETAFPPDTVHEEPPISENAYGAAASEILDAEKQLKITFAADYRAFLAGSGARMSRGHKIVGICALPAMNVVSVTQEEHNRNPAILHSWYVIERIHAGSVVVWQDESGSIYQVQLSDPPVKIASGLTEYMNS